MNVRRSAVGVGVLDGVLYAVGGTDGFKVHRSVEAYSLSRGVWTTVPNMHLCRQFPGKYNFKWFHIETYFLSI